MSDLGGTHVTRVGTCCYMRLYLRVTHGFSASHNLLTLPADMRPPANAFVTAEATRSGETSHRHADVTSGGQVLVPLSFSAGDGLLVWGSWAVEP